MPPARSAAVFSDCTERDRAFLQLEKKLRVSAKNHLERLRNDYRRPLICRMKSRLTGALTGYGFVEVSTPLLLAKGLLEKMSITEAHPLYKQIYWVDRGKCLRPMLAPNLYYLLTDLLRIWEKPVRIFEIGSCFRKESQGAHHLNEFTMLNLVEMGLPLEQRRTKLAEYASLVIETAGLDGYKLVSTASEVYGETVDIEAGGLEMGSGAIGPHSLDENWGITVPWEGELLTRLTSQNVGSIARNLASHDRELSEKTGLSIWQLACRTICLQDPEALPRSSLKTAVIPVSSGLGVIDGFTGAVAAIARHLGFPAFITGGKDVAGFAEAIKSGAALLLLADDHRFIAYNTSTARIVDNAAATGSIFAAALEQMAGGLKGKEVLVIGCGRVGESAALVLSRAGAEVVLYDIVPHRSAALKCRLQSASDLHVKIEASLERALARYRLILDASPAADLVDRQHVDGQTRVVSPGVPHGLTPAARQALSSRFLHDSLELGVAAMLAAAAAGYDFPLQPVKVNK
jgi:pyrrolysyl-tRNA synthetase-like protein